MERWPACPISTRTTTSYPLPAAVEDLRGQIAGRRDALLICTPEYAGALPGSFKNLLDWTVGGMAIQANRLLGSTCQRRQPVPSVRTSHCGSCSTTSTPISSTTPAGTFPVAGAAVGQDGIIVDDGLRRQIADVLDVLADHVTATRGD